MAFLQNILKSEHFGATLYLYASDQSITLRFFVQKLCSCNERSFHFFTKAQIGLLSVCYEAMKKVRSANLKKKVAEGVWTHWIQAVTPAGAAMSRAVAQQRSRINNCDDLREANTKAQNFTLTNCQEVQIETIFKTSSFLA